jgi:hypothetical protein
MGGELIDVSIGHKDDMSVKKFYKELRNNISLFELSLMNDTHIGFRSYSLTYLFKDIYRILFVDVTYPWDDIKYVKRLNRMFYIGYIDLFTKFADNKNRLQYLELLQDIMTSIEQILQDDDTHRHVENDNLKRDIQKIKTNIEEGSLLFDILLNKVLELLLEDDGSRKTQSTNSISDPREEFAPYNVDGYTSDGDEGVDITGNIQETSNESVYEHKIGFIKACNANLDVLLASFKNIDMYCHKYPFDEQILYKQKIQ